MKKSAVKRRNNKEIADLGNLCAGEPKFQTSADQTGSPIRVVPHGGVVGIKRGALRWPLNCRSSRPRHRRWFGLDIGSSSVKAGRIVRSGVAACCDWNATASSRSRAVRGRRQYRTRSKWWLMRFKRVYRRCGTRIRNVALALPASAVITKRIALPGNLREEEMEMQVESDANQYIPFALEEVSLDFQVIGRFRTLPRTSRC